MIELGRRRPRREEILRHSFWPTFMREVESLGNDLLRNARLETTRKDIMGAPGFKVFPNNENAAPFSGYLEVYDLNLKIGRFARYEIYGFGRGGKVISRMSWQKELRWIWEAIMAGGFREHLIYDSDGKVVSSIVRISVPGRNMVFAYGGLISRLRGGIEKTITYEPYLTVSPSFRQDLKGN